MKKEYNEINLGKEKFFEFFKEISDIPRKSSEEKRIADYLVKFAKYRNLEYYRDNRNNVIIRKKASKGLENRPVLGLQNHIDMVCEKSVGIKHNFSKDKLNLYIEDDYVKAKGTTLGADNGVGVAYVLAILDSTEILAPELECIFTTEEETTMNGARFLDISQVKSKRIISFDSFYEDIMVVNSSSCKEWSSKKKVKYQNLDPNKYNSYLLEFSNFKGGHSGLDIGCLKRGNPIKLCFELLEEFNDVYIKELNGGSRLSVIPRDMKLKFCINKEEEYKIKKIRKRITGLLEYYGEDVKINLDMINDFSEYISKNNTKEIIDFVNEFQNGSLKTDSEEQIILSANLGVTEIIDKEVIFRYSSRSNERSLGNKKYRELNDLVKKYNMEVFEYDEMKPFEPPQVSELVNKASEIYFNTFGKEVKKIKSQTCLEIGFLAEKIEDLEYIAVAPNIYNAHSPNEKFSISSSKKFWQYIVNLLKFI